MTGCDFSLMQKFCSRQTSLCSFNSFHIFGAVNLHHGTQLDAGIQDKNQPLRVVLTRLQGDASA